jgi:hypothetical protein
MMCFKDQDLNETYLCWALIFTPNQQRIKLSKDLGEICISQNLEETLLTVIPTQKA